MEDDGDENEHGKDKEREDQSGQHDFLADAHDFRVSGDLNTCTTDLSAECDDIVRDEDEGEPFGAHAGQMLCVEGADDPTEDHVYGCGDEGRRAHNKHLL